jgi:hypothetical protein
MSDQASRTAGKLAAHAGRQSILSNSSPTLRHGPLDNPTCNFAGIIDAQSLCDDSSTDVSVVKRDLHHPNKNVHELELQRWVQGQARAPILPHRVLSFQYTAGLTKSLDNKRTN